MSDGGHSPRQNRVLPTGEIVSHPARGLFMGNRGRLHDDTGAIGGRRWTTQNWIICKTAFKGRRRTLMAPGCYTELFFLDEAVALAAGHRPCGECRRLEYRAFVACWAKGNGLDRVPPREMDASLHRARIDSQTRQQRAYSGDLDDLPDGAFIRMTPEAAPALVLGERLVPFEDMRYGAAMARPQGVAVGILTPAPSVAALKAGYRPAIHPTAMAA